MRAWIEWHFVDWGRLKKKGRSFFCDKCKETVQNARKCHEDSWDVRGLSAHVPIDFLEFSSGFNFCPAKLFRDDPEFAYYMQYLMVCWKVGQIPDGDTFSLIDEEFVNDLYDMIVIWERAERMANYWTLGFIIGGDPDSKK